MIHQKSFRPLCAALALIGCFAITACNSVDPSAGARSSTGSDTRPHNPVTRDAQLSPAGNPGGTTPAGPAGSH